MTGNRKIRDFWKPLRWQDRVGRQPTTFARRRHPTGAVAPDVPVLMYHSLQENGADYQVTAAQLEEQLHWLSQNGYESVTSADLLAWMTYGIPLPEKPIMITIDDGNCVGLDYFSNCSIGMGSKVVFSLPNYAQLTASQIRTLDRAGEVCGHTVSHENLSTLSI